MTIFGKPFQETQSRLILMAAGAILFAIQLLFCKLALMLAAIAGWWWIVLAAQACDLFFSSVAGPTGQGGAFLWFICVSGVYLFPWVVLPKDMNASPAEGLMHLQISLGAVVLLGAAQDLFQT